MRPLKFTFELHVFQDGRLSEVLETPVNEFADEMEMAHALAHFALLQTGIIPPSRFPIGRTIIGEDLWRKPGFNQKKEPRIRFIDVTNEVRRHIEEQSDTDPMRNASASPHRLILPSTTEGYSHRTRLVITKINRIEPGPAKTSALAAA